MNTFTQDIEVFPLPNPTFNDPTDVCIDAGIQTINSGASPTGGVFSGTGVTDNADGVTYDFNPLVAGVGTHVITYTYTDGNGCVNTFTQDIEVFPLPVVTPTSNSPICDKEHLFLMANPSGGTPLYSFEWDRFPLNSMNRIRENPNVWNAMIGMDDGIYNVIVTDMNGCTGTGSTVVDITPNVQSPGSIEGDEVLCGPGQIPGPILEDEAPEPDSLVDYFWMKRPLGTSIWQACHDCGYDSECFPTEPIFETTEFVRCVRLNGCILSFESNIVTKTVGTDAVANIMGPTGVCLPSQVQYSVTPQEGATYHWDFGNRAEPQTANTSSVLVTWDNPNDFGVHYITLTVTRMGCTSVQTIPIFVSPIYCGNCLLSPEQDDCFDNYHSEVFINPELDILRNQDKLGIQVFPNPFRDQLHVKFGMGLEENTQYRVVDTSGKVHKMGRISSGETSVLLDLASMPNGLYFLQLNLKEGIVHQKVIKN